MVQNGHAKEGEKEAQKNREAAALAEEENRLLDLLRRAEAAHVIVVIDKFNRLMQKRGLRIRDLFSKSGFDKSGDGSLDSKELCAALAELEIPMSKAEITKMIRFIDDSGNGELEAEELESTVRSIKQARLL